MLELLDQVEDVISVDDSESDKVEASGCQVQTSKHDEIPVGVELAIKSVAAHLPEKITGRSSCYNFLVLEVSSSTLMDSLLKDGGLLRG